MKTFILYIFRSLGGFWLARLLVSNKTLVLAYHSFEVIDETSFRPKVFIKKSTFERRLAFLKKHNNIIKLDDLFKQDKPKNSVVITIDDGWASTLTLASPLLQRFNFPYTIYLTTESVLAQQPIFHILLDYMLRKSLGKILIMSSDNNELIHSIITLVNLTELTDKIEKLKVEKYDTELLRKIANSLGFDIGEIINSRAFSLLSSDSVVKIVETGADIQLHTHTHQSYLSDELAFNNEITINQDHIEKIVGIKPFHHCYPSGSYNDKSTLWLKRLGIKTATTCKPGFCDEHSDKFELPRFLDGENISQIVFEAEVSGVLELLRNFKSKLLIR